MAGSLPGAGSGHSIRRILALIVLLAFVAVAVVSRVTVQCGLLVPEMTQVVVAARDLPAGTVLTRDELMTSVKTKVVSKDSLPPVVVTVPGELIGKRLTRPVRAEEAFDPADLTTGFVADPEGRFTSHLDGVVQTTVGPIGSSIGPGSRVDVLATLRRGNKLCAFPLLVNVLVIGVDSNPACDKGDAISNMNTASFAVREKEALLLSLAKSRGCALELMLRHPNKTSDANKNYNFESVFELLADIERPPICRMAE